MTDKIIATTTKNLEKIIQLEIKMNGNNCDLNHIDVSRIIDMAGMFQESQFKGDISKWDVSHVTNMSYMFYQAQFNGDISKWNVSNVTNMDVMFKDSQFNGDLTKWLPYSLAYYEDALKDCKASRPYWAKFTNIIDRNEAISKYLLYSELNKKLHSKVNFTKKYKI